MAKDKMADSSLKQRFFYEERLRRFEEFKKILESRTFSNRAVGTNLAANIVSMYRNKECPDMYASNVGKVLISLLEGPEAYNTFRLLEVLDPTHQHDGPRFLRECEHIERMMKEMMQKDEPDHSFDDLKNTAFLDGEDHV